MILTLIALIGIKLLSAFPGTESAMTSLAFLLVFGGFVGDFAFLTSIKNSPPY